MRVGIMQPYFFPYLAYWQLINAVDRYVVYDDVTFIKGGWISRNNILLNNAPHMITLPLDNPSSFRNINEIGITSNMKARQKVLRTIEAAYKKAPYYHVIMPVIERLISESGMISELNYNTITEIVKYTGIDTEIILSSELEKDTTLARQEKVIDINRILGSDMYINAIGGQEIYTSQLFEEQGIELRFLKMKDVTYKQYTDDFVPNLSIIDVLMFNDADTVREMLSQYELVGE